MALYYSRFAGSENPRHKPSDFFTMSIDDRPAKHGLETMDILDSSLTIPSRDQTDDVDTGIYDSERPLTSKITKPEQRISHINQTELRVQIRQTSLAALGPRANDDDAPQSVIHAPPGFRQFVRIMLDDLWVVLSC